MMNNDNDYMFSGGNFNELNTKEDKTNDANASNLPIHFSKGSLTCTSGLDSTFSISPIVTKIKHS